MTTTKAVNLPINLALGVGAYTTKLFVGSQQVEVNVMLDTGSSTLAIDLKKYQPNDDKCLKTTVYAQDVVYGSGGWAGPVIKTQIELNHSQQLKLNDAPIAITADSQQQNFQLADGIWGLAYHHLNKSYDVSEFLNQHSPILLSTYPWPFEVDNNPAGIKTFKKYLRQFPEKDITPLFTDFEIRQIVTNQFSLLTHRSVEYVPRDGMSIDEIAAEPLNQGVFSIGTIKPDECDAIKSTEVMHDAYYNTHLKSVAVEGFPACQAPPLDDQHINSFFTNSIIDSGCSFLVMQQKIYQYIMDCFRQQDDQWITSIDQFNAAFKQNKAYLNTELDLNAWPDLIFSFAGPNGSTAELTVAAKEYWQRHAKAPDNWMFMIMSQLPHWPEQSICGLPLINSYLCVFDRSTTKNGLIHWIDKRT